MAIIGRKKKKQQQQQGVAAAATSVAVAVAALLVAAAEAEPSPGVYPSRMFRAREFGRDFRSLWGAEHQQQAAAETGVTVWLDSSSGSGFKSRRAYRSGYFGAWVRLQPGYTAGVITAFYLSNSEAHPGWHDEVDMEFLGTTPGRPYTLQTNVFALGSGDPPRSLGREIKFHLWFDPTADFHHYAILWTTNHIISAHPNDVLLVSPPPSPPPPSTSWPGLVRLLLASFLFLLLLELIMMRCPYSTKSITNINRRLLTTNLLYPHHQCTAFLHSRGLDVAVSTPSPTSAHYRAADTHSHPSKPTISPLFVHSL